MEHSIWKLTQKDQWKLFFNLGIKPAIESDIKPRSQPIHNLSIAHISNHQPLTLGTLFISSKGIGKLIKLDNTTATLRMSQSNLDETFDINEISNTINLLLKQYDNNFINWNRVTLSVNGNVQSIKDYIDKLQLFNATAFNYSLLANGNELKDDYTFEQLDFKQNNKLLIVKERLHSNTIKRYKSIYEWWYGFNNDGISFSCNKKIKLTGVGLYRSHENKTQNGEVIVCEECSPSIHLTEVLCIEIAPTRNREEVIYPVMFSKPILIKPGIVYMVEFKCNNPCSMYYGNQGQPIISGEKKIEFTFKLSLREFRHGTNIQSGNFPEFYYYA